MPAWQTPPDLATNDILTETATDIWSNDLQHLKDRLDRVYLNSGPSVVAGDVCVLRLDAGDAYIERSSSAGQAGPHVVALQDIPNVGTGYCARTGLALVNVVGTVNRGDWLQTSATAGKATAGTTNPFGIALTAPVGGQVWALLGRDGTVTSVGLAAPSEFTVSGSPVTMAGTLTLAKATQSANTVWAGPASGAAAAPSFRALVLADHPVPPAAWVGRSTDVSIPDGIFTTLSWEVERYDAQNCFDPAQPTRLTAPVAGVYVVTVEVWYANNNSPGIRDIRLRHNTDYVALDRRENIASMGHTPAIARAVVPAQANDYFQVVAYQNSGAAATISALGLFGPSFAIAWLGPRI